MKKVLVIGGGASGIMAAISAARHGAAVTILEHGTRIGKKILSTGNGRCNITNQVQEQKFYHGSDPKFALGILSQFTFFDTVKLFGELGIYTRNRNGYLYPYSDQASAVLDVLLMEIAQRKIQVICEAEVLEFHKRNGLSVKTSKGEWKADAAILAAGSKAASKTGSDGSGYLLAHKMGHRIVTPVPALVPLRSPDACFKQLAGVRTMVVLTLIIDGIESKVESGELQLTEYGLSGIVTFQISRFAARALDEKKKVTILVDFMPEHIKHEVALYLENRANGNRHKTAEQFLIGLFPKKLGTALLKKAGIPAVKLLSNWTSKDFSSLVKQIKAFVVPITGTNSFEQAQVCAGGICTDEVDEITLESKKKEELYLAGEILDIDGACGGYNLQWAWSSGYVAGKYAAMPR